MSTLKRLGAASAGILKTLIGPMVGRDAIADAVGYITNAGAPTRVTPDFIGQHLLDTTNSVWYTANSTTAGDWAVGPRTPATKAEVVTATNVITADESGKTFFLNSATEFVSTLPAPAAGLEFEFIVTAAPSGASYTIVTTSSANIIKGQVYSSDLNAASDGDFETSGGDTISLVDAKAVAGDRVVVKCDGTNWFAYCFCSVFDAITITTAS